MFVKWPKDSEMGVNNLRNSVKKRDFFLFHASQFKMYKLSFIMNLFRKSEKNFFKTAEQMNLITTSRKSFLDMKIADHMNLHL